MAGTTVAPQGLRRDTRFSVEATHSPSGRRFLWVRGGDQRAPVAANSDAGLNLDGYISVTPMRADLTAPDALEALRGVLE